MATYKQCKYCMLRIQEEDLAVFLCTKCMAWVHERCCVTTASTSHRASHLKGDYLFTLECRECSYTRSDTFTRMKLTWVQLIHLALYNLTVNETGRQGYFRWKEDICRFIDHNWSCLMPGREKSPAISGTIAGVLSIHGKLFKSGGHVFRENGWWALQRVAPPISNADNYKMFKSMPPSCGSTGHPQKRGIGHREVSASENGADESIYGRGKRQRGTKEKKKKENVTTAVSAKNARIDNSGISSGRNSVSIHAAHNVNNNKNNTIQSKRHPETKMEPNLEDFCSLTDNIQLSNDDISNNGDSINNNNKNNNNNNNGNNNNTTTNDSNSNNNSNNNNDSNNNKNNSNSNDGNNNNNNNNNNNSNNNNNCSNNNVDMGSVVIKTEPTCFDSFPALDSYDRKVAQENGLFPLDDENPFSMEYSPEDIADFIPPMFDEKSEFDKIVEEFKEYNAQRESNQKEHDPKEDNQKEGDPQEQNLCHQDFKIEQDPIAINKQDMLLEVPEVQVETTKETEKISFKNEIENEEKEENDIQEEGVKSVKEGSPHCKSNADKTVQLSIQDEAVLLGKLNEFEFVLNADPSLRRLRRKLLVRKMKREKGQKIFSLQESCESYAQKDAPAENLRFEAEEPVKVEEKLGTAVPARGTAESGKSGELTKQAYHHPALRDINVLDRFFNFSHEIPNSSFKRSIYVRLVGHSEETITSRSITSPYTSRVLKPYIRRDFQSVPRKLKLLREIKNHPKNRNNVPSDRCTWPIDYCYVQPHHLPAVNALCSDFFWPGIEMTEALQYPEFSCVVVYRKLVIGFAFMVPDVKYNEAYISFILVHPDWQRANIGTNMMYHLIQTCMGKDITLHVSPANTSLLFYQKFGFKAEKLLLGFYNKYLPEGDTTCPHAFVLRLRR